LGGFYLITKSEASVSEYLDGSKVACGGAVAGSLEI
jgi:hypothetical protein